jgi:hypothetical protein
MARLTHPPPNFWNGYATCAAESEYPWMWRGLAGAWTPGIGNTAGTARDFSGFKKNGTITNADLSTFWARGWKFDGADDYIDTSTTTVGSIFTLVAWLHPAAVDTTYAILGKRSGTARTWAFYTRPTGNLGFTLSGVDDYNSSDGGLLANTWQQATAVVSGTSLALYRDRTNVLTTTMGNSALDDATTMDIGADGVGATLFSGNIDDVRIYNRTLSAQEIAYSYSLGPNAIYTLRRRANVKRRAITFPPVSSNQFSTIFHSRVVRGVQ